MSCSGASFASPTLSSECLRNPVVSVSFNATPERVKNALMIVAVRNIIIYLV
jgi:hypothetical protein